MKTDNFESEEHPNHKNFAQNIRLKLLLNKVKPFQIQRQLCRQLRGITGQASSAHVSETFVKSSSASDHATGLRESWTEDSATVELTDCWDYSI